MTKTLDKMFKERHSCEANLDKTNSLIREKAQETILEYLRAEKRPKTYYEICDAVLHKNSNFRCREILGALVDLIRTSQIRSPRHRPCDYTINNAYKK